MADEITSDGSITNEIMGEPVIPKSVKEVQFYGDTIIAVVLEDGSIYVPLRPITDALGLNFSAQYRRSLRDEVLSKYALNVLVNLDGSQARPMFALPLELIPGYLFGLTASRVKPELRERILLYKLRCHAVLWQDVKSEIGMPARLPAPVVSGAEMALDLARAVQTLAEQQVDFERGLRQVRDQSAATAGQQEQMAGYLRTYIPNTNRQLRDHAARLARLELRLDPTAQLTDAESAEVQLAVKNVGQAMEARGRGSYSKVYSEMYRRYRVSSYKLLPRSLYAEVLAWLSGWYDEVVGTGE